MRQVWLHGVGTVTAVGAAWLLFAFLADWGLHVPLGVRLFHGLVLLALPAFFLWRDLLRPLRRVPDRAGLAVLIERTHPELKQLLVSAAQLQQHGDGDPGLVQRVIEEAEGRIDRLDLSGVVHERPPRLRFAGGLLSVAVLSGLFLANRDLAGIFFERMVGLGTPWPQSTHLLVEVPLHGDGAQVSTVPGPREDTPRAIVVRIARGGDVPVHVTALGEVPDDVTLHFEGGQDVVLASGGDGVFRQTLRSCQEDTSFYVTGGDDDDELPLVKITVLQPPDVAGLAVRITPPEYSGLQPETVYNRDVEVLAGSRLSVHVLPDPADARGVARLLPENREIPLEARPYPHPDPGPGSGDDAAAGAGLGFDVYAEKSLRYRLELTDPGGLSNPDPGLFSVRVVEDRPPELLVLAPGRGDVETVIGGVLALRVRAEDDFGLTELAWSATPFQHDGGTPGSGAPSEPVQRPGGALPWEPLPDPLGPGGLAAPAGPGGEPVKIGIGRTRIEVAELAPPGTILAEGQVYSVEFTARDNQTPEAGESRSSPVRVRIVTADELLRRVQDRLARARLQATALAEIQREKRQRVEELLDSLKSDAPLEGGDEIALDSALTGQRRVQGDAQALARELASITESVLYARLDDKAGALFEFLDARLARGTDRNFRPGPWRELARAHAERQLGSPGFAGNLVDILGLSMEIGEDHASEAVLALERARDAGAMGEISDALVESVELQTLTLNRIEDLLERLAEWDNFQSVVTLARDILARQKALQDRLKDIGSDK